MSYELPQNISNGLLRMSAIGTVGAVLLTGGAVEGCGKQSDESTSAPTVAEAPVDQTAGKYNLDRSMGGTALECTGVTFKVDGENIAVTITITPPDLKGVTTRYKIESSEKTVKGEFKGTSKKISSDGIGRHVNAYAKMAYPFGKDTRTDDCNGQSVPIEGWKK